MTDAAVCWVGYDATYMVRLFKWTGMFHRQGCGMGEALCWAWLGDWKAYVVGMVWAV